MNTLIPGAPLRSLSPTTNEYQRAQGESRAAKPARAARFTLDAPEHSGTIPGASNTTSRDILTPGVALTSNLAVIFTLNQHTTIVPTLPKALCRPLELDVSERLALYGSSSRRSPSAILSRKNLPNSEFSSRTQGTVSFVPMKSVKRESK